jgi:DNA polymerase-3 subunit epsilon
VSWFDEFVAWDTETTGFGADARILEIGAVVFANGEPVHEWSQLLCPEGVDWESKHVQEALAVNGIKREELAGKPRFNQILPDLLLEFEFATWVAHNSEFDERMLRQELVRAGVVPGVLGPKMPVCTKQLSSYLTNDKGHRLQDVAPRYGVPYADAHRAVADARMCGQVLCAMYKSGKLPSDPAEMVEFTRRADVSAKSRQRRY